MMQRCDTASISEERQIPQEASEWAFKSYKGTDVVPHCNSCFHTTRLANRVGTLPGNNKVKLYSW